MMWRIIDWIIHFKEKPLNEFLLVLLGFTLLIWYMKFLWGRRKLYQTSFSLPGPFALPFIGSTYLFIGKTYDIFENVSYLFSTYPGKLKFWFGPRLIYGITDPKYFEILLTSPHALKKDNFYRFMEPLLGQGLLSAASVTYWKNHRKIINRIFKQKTLDQFLEIFVRQSEVLNDVLKKYSGKGETDVFKLLHTTTLDMIGETAMGVQLQAQATNSSLPEQIDSLMETVIMRMFKIYYHLDIVFNNSSLGRNFYATAQELRSFIKEVVTERKKLRYEEEVKSNGTTIMEEGFERKTFLDFLIDINYEGKHHFTDEELLNETLTFVIAGSDTSATCNCFTFTMLGMHQVIQDKVLAEILEVVGPVGSVELKHLPKLQYLERVIKESLRLFPLAPFFLRTADADVDLGDFVVHKGCSVLFGVLWVHRSEKYWPDPYKFDPNRFLPEEVAKRTPGTFIPFSYGPRNCIGMQYGMMSMKTLLATVLRKYRVYTGHKSVEEIELQSNLVLRPKNGFKVSFELRNS